MDEILLFIVKYCSALYNKLGFRFVKSEVTDSFGGNCYLILESEFMMLHFVKDRGQLFLDFESKLLGKKRELFSLDVVRQDITKEKELKSLLDEENGCFLLSNFRNYCNFLQARKYQ